MSSQIESIASAVRAAGESAHLWLQDDAGDCILWPNEKSSVGDDGANAIGRWKLTPDEVEELNDSDVCIDQHN